MWFFWSRAKQSTRTKGPGGWAGDWGWHGPTWSQGTQGRTSGAFPSTKGRATGFGIAQWGITNRLLLHCIFTEGLTLTLNKEKLQENVCARPHHPHKRGGIVLLYRRCWKSSGIYEWVSRRWCLHAGITRRTQPHSRVRPSVLPGPVHGASQVKASSRLQARNRTGWACVGPAQGAGGGTASVCAPIHPHTPPVKGCLGNGYGRLRHFPP